MSDKSSKIVFLFALLFFAVIGSSLNGFNYGQANAQGISDTNITGDTNSTGHTNSTSGFYSNKDLFVTTEPTGYGIYEEKNSTSYSPGEPIILYIEPVGFEYNNITDEDGTPLFSIDFGASFLITSSNGTILGGQENVPIGNIISHNQNKEVFIPFTVTQSVPFPTGDYVIIYEITDENSGKSFELNKNITIR
jgi:hypothetical protein